MGGVGVERPTEFLLYEAVGTPIGLRLLLRSWPPNCSSVGITFHDSSTPLLSSACCFQPPKDSKRTTTRFRRPQGTEAVSQSEGQRNGSGACQPSEFLTDRKGTDHLAFNLYSSVENHAETQRTQRREERTMTLTSHGNLNLKGFIHHYGDCRTLSVVLVSSEISAFSAFSA